MDTPKPTKGLKIKGKKVPPAALAGIAGVAIIGAVYLHKKKSSTEANSANATEPGAYQQGVSNQSFIPVTGGAGEVGGGGAGGGYSGLTTSGPSAENTALLELIKSNSENEDKRIESERSFYTTLLSNLGTGGGPPASGQNSSGGGSGGGGSGPTTSTPPATPPGVVAPPSGPTTVVPRNITCPNGCAGHEYPKGKLGKGSKTVECQTKVKGKCQW